YLATFEKTKAILVIFPLVSPKVAKFFSTWPPSGSLATFGSDLATFGQAPLPAAAERLLAGHNAQRFLRPADGPPAQVSRFRLVADVRHRHRAALEQLDQPFGDRVASGRFR